MRSPVGQRAAAVRFAVLCWVAILLLAGVLLPVLATPASGQSMSTDEVSTEMTHITDADGESLSDEESTGDPSGLGPRSLDATSGVVLLATYSKYNDVSPLEHDARSEIADLVATAPGIYLGQVVRSTGEPPSTVRYHLKILEREGHLTVEKLWGKSRVFPSSVPSGAFAPIALRREPAKRRVMRVVRECSGCPAGEIAERLDCSPSTVSHHLNQLEAADLIRRDRDGQRVEVSLGAAATGWEREERVVPPEERPGPVEPTTSARNHRRRVESRTD